MGRDVHSLWQVWDLLWGEAAPEGTGSWLQHLSPVTVVQTLRDSCSQPGMAAHTKLQILPQSWGQPRVPSQSCCPPHPPGAGQKGSLTIMFSRAYLASQQFRNTGMNKFRKGGQNIYKSKGYSQKNPRSFKKYSSEQPILPVWKDPS